MVFSANNLGGSQAIKDKVIQACHSLVIPVARFLLRSGIGYREFASVSRVAFVQVASEEFGIRGRPTNASRIAAMTGIPRKEVARIRETSDKFREDAKKELSPLSDVLQRWHASERYTDQDGIPIPLPIEGQNGSFTELVRDCAGDVPVSAVRAELVRCGAITIDEWGQVRVRRREVVPDSFDTKLISSISFSLSALAQTIAHNCDPTRKGPGRIERYVQSDELSPETRRALRPLIRERVERFSREIDTLVAEYSSPSSHRADEGFRIGVGVFYAEDSDPV